jgi:hypothetical protein
MGAERSSRYGRYWPLADEALYIANVRYGSRKLPQYYAGENVRFDISIAQSNRSGVGQPKSRPLGAHCGRRRPMRRFSKADATPGRFSAIMGGQSVTRPGFWGRLSERCRWCSREGGIRDSDAAGAGDDFLDVVASIGHEFMPPGQLGK